METGTTYPPEGSGAPRRGLFTRRPDAPETRPAYGSTRTLEQVLEQRLEEGLRAIEDEAASLMREIAQEMWRASGADVASEQDRILNFLSRDQAIRSLIASSDDRFQALAVRTARLEDALAELAENGRQIREAVQISARSIHEIAASPTLQGVELVRTQLEQVEQHIAATFATLDQRDRALTESIQEKVKEHGDLIARETARIVEAMESYVQGGAEAMGRLAQRIEEHAAAFAEHDDTLAEKLRGTVAEETREMAGQIQMLSERVGIQGRAGKDLQHTVEQLIETRTMGLAQLIRSDSQALQGLIERSTSEQQERLRDAVDERMAALTLAVSGAIERKLSELSERVDEQLVSVAEIVATRAAEASVVSGSQSQEGIVEAFDARLAALAKMIRSDNRVLAERMSTAAPATGEGEADIQKQTLRAVKELQAGMGADVMGAVDRRFQSMADQLHKETQSTAEAMIKVAEVLGEKIDRVAVRVDEGVGGDLQIVIDRMTDAIQAMSGRGRREQGRFEID